MIDPRRESRRQRLILSAVLLVVLAACAREVSTPPAPVQNPMNVVLVIGDGFGIGAWSLAHAVAAVRGDTLALSGPAETGFLSTSCADALVTDSAAAASAWSTGVLGKRFAIAPPDSTQGASLLFDELRARGRSHGFVTTTRVTHATPAPFYARVGHRDEEDSIAAQLVRAAPDVAIGGGLVHFLPRGKGGARADKRDLVAAAEKAGIAVLRKWETPLPTRKPVLALLAQSHLPHELDRRGEPDLAELVTAAIAKLDATDKPWFLLVEEGEIDIAAHAHDAAGVAANTLRLDRCIAAIRRVVDPAKTLVVLTADHATSGPSILEFAHPESLEIATASIERMDARIFGSGPWVGTPRGLEHHAVEVLDEGSAHTGLSGGDLDALLTMRTPGDRAAALGTILSRRFGIAFIPLEDHVRSTAVHGHTAELVAVRAWGPRAEEVRGLRDHAALGRWLRDVLGAPIDTTKAPLVGSRA